MAAEQDPPVDGSAHEEFGGTEIGTAAAPAGAPEPSVWGRIALIADRTLVLFIGLAIGAVVGASFFGTRGGPAIATVAPVASTTPGASATPGGASPATAVAPDAAPRFDAGFTKAVAEGRPLHIGVFGDSFGIGLGEGLYLQFREDKAYVVHQFSKQATGFTRYKKLDLLQDIKAKVDAQPVDIAVISFGANDTFDIYADGVAAKYMSSEWQQIVGKRVDSVIQALRDHGAMVYWVGLPKMRDADFDAKVAQMNAFYSTRMRALGVPFIDTVPLSVDATGQYTAYVTDPKSGKSELIRANDGIHMATGHAYSLLTRGLQGRIRDYVALAKVEADRQAALRGSAH